MKPRNEIGRKKTFALNKSLYLFSVIALYCFNYSYAEEFPKTFNWLTDTVYISTKAEDGGDGSKEAPYNEISDFQFTSKRAYLFERDDTLIFYGASIGADSIFIGTYGHGQKPTFLGQNTGHHFSFSGTEQYIQALKVVCKDTGTCFRFRTNDENKFLWADSIEAIAAFKGMEPSGYGKIIISNSLITRIRADGLYASHNDTIIVRNTEITNVNRWFDVIPDIGNSGGDCYQGESNGYVEVTGCYFDHSDVAGKFAMIQNGADTVVVKKSKFVSYSESAAVYGGPPKGWRFEECEFIGGVYGIRNFSHLIIENCIFQEQSTSAIHGDGAEIYNSNFINIKGNRVLNGWGTKGWKVKNSIFYNVNHIFGANEEYVWASNNVYYNQSGEHPTNQWGENIYNYDPLFENDTNFRLQSSSKLVDLGVVTDNITCDFDGIRRPIGASSDIGAFEYHTSDDSDSIPPQKPDKPNTNTNNAPVIAADYSSSVYSGFVEKIDASGSHDPDGDDLTYEWKTSDDIELSSSDSSIVRFLTPSPLQSETIYTLSLIVSDGSSTSTKSFEITAMPYKPEIGELNLKSVESSNYQAPNYPENIIDHDLFTRWSSEGDDQWVIMEFESLATLSYLSLSYHHGDYRQGYFKIQASADKENWTEILPEQKTCGISTANENFAVPTTKASNQYKYIKFVGEGNSENKWNSICELSIFGETHKSSNIEETIASTPIKVYPNPASDRITIETSMNSKTPLKVQVLSIDGKTILVDAFNGELQKELQLNLDSGIYQMVVNYSDGTAYSKTLIIK